MIFSENSELKELLDFEYVLNHKVYGMSTIEESYELIYEGRINKLFEPTFPKTIGCFELLIYDLGKAKDFNRYDEILEQIDELSTDFNSRFSNITKVFNNPNLNVKDKERVIILKNFVLHPDWRKKDIFKELIKSIYISHFIDDSIFIVNSSPIQNCDEELEGYMKEYPIDVSDGNGEYDEYMCGEYFELDDLPASDEQHDYKLFSKMQSVNLKQIDDTEYFYQNNKKEFIKLFNEK